MNRRIVWITTLCLIGQMGLAWAQTKQISAHQPSLGTPADSSAQILNKRWMALKRQIQSDMRNGKLTRYQAGEMMAKLKAVHHQSMQLKKQTTKRQLTSDQETQVNKQLDEIATSL